VVLLDHYFIRRYILFSSLMNLHKRVYITLRSEGGEAEDRIQKSEVRSQKSGGRRQETGDRKLNNTVIPAGF